MRPGDVDHDRRGDGLARGERHAPGAAALAEDRGDLAVEAEPGTLGLGGALGVVARELRVVDVARAGEEHAALDPALGRAEGRIVGPLGRAEAAEVVERQARPDPVGAPVLVGDAERVHVAADRAQVIVGLGLHHQAAALDELRKAALVRRGEIARPVVPGEEALVGERRAVEGRVVGADDRAGRAGRAVARRRQLVEVERPPAALGELVGGARADDPGADDDRVVGLAHVFASSLRARRRALITLHLGCAPSICPPGILDPAAAVERRVAGRSIASAVMVGNAGTRLASDGWRPDGYLRAPTPWPCRRRDPARRRPARRVHL